MTASDLPNGDLPLRPPEDCKVLVVDDDERIVEIFSLLLGREGYQVLPATDGYTALEIIRQEHPDIAVLDVRLPGLDGIELCQRIKSDPETRFLPVILMTGGTTRHRRMDGLKAGASEFLNKPLDPAELTVRVRSLLRAKQLQDAVREELERLVAERTRELQEAYEQLREMDRLKANIMAIISHELRTPLLQARNALDILADEEIGDRAKKTAQQKLREALGMLEYRVEDVKVFSDPSELKLTPASMVTLIAGAVEQVRKLRRQSELPIETDVPRGLPPVMVDPPAITRALAHIIDNGVKYGEGRPVYVSATEGEQGIRVTVRDEGEGIPESVRPHLFTPLQQGEHGTTRRHGGIGIGMALVKMILDAHQVEIDIQSEVGKGTTVTFVLPIADLQRSTSTSGGDEH
ncbi:MAG TPA: hybrid sensor histidine kinase/response regulator [Chloroflexi bacterium]|nr:hybrid sensor histidine kinase/response regulator [Chloroflexota bacterium]